MDAHWSNFERLSENDYRYAARKTTQLAHLVHIIACSKLRMIVAILQLRITTPTHRYTYANWWSKENLPILKEVFEMVPMCASKIKKIFITCPVHVISRRNR